MSEIKYNGYEEIKLTDEQFNQMYCEGKIDGYEFLENEYLLAQDEKGNIVDKLVCHNGKLEEVRYQTLKNSYLGTIKPRNPQQHLVIDTLLDPTSKIKVIKGVYGSGKDYLMLAAALQLIEKGKFERIVWVRNNVSVKDAPEIGYLPGTEIDKLMPYVMPLADHAGGEEGIKKMLENGTLEVIPLGHLRGRSLRNCIVFCTECENLTRQHIQLLMGRIDEGSQLWLDGDVKQRDKDIFEKSAGLERMIERLAGNRLFAHIHLEKSERSEVAALADLLD